MNSYIKLKFVFLLINYWNHREAKVLSLLWPGAPCGGPSAPGPLWGPVGGPPIMPRGGAVCFSPLPRPMAATRQWVSEMDEVCAAPALLLDSLSHSSLALFTMSHTCPTTLFIAVTCFCNNNQSVLRHTDKLWAHLGSFEGDTASFVLKLHHFQFGVRLGLGPEVVWHNVVRERVQPSLSHSVEVFVHVRLQQQRQNGEVAQRRRLVIAQNFRQRR